MQTELDWRHWTGAALLLLLLVFAGWQVLNRPGERPNAVAPTGANPRMEDAPDYPPGNAPGSAALPPGLAR